MLYDITLRIDYAYDNDADSSRHVLRLLPAELPGEQRLIAGNIDIDPRPEEWRNGVDFFGNRFAEVALLTPHRHIAFTMAARVERISRELRMDMSPPLGALAGEVAASARLDAMAPHHFLAASQRVPASEDTAAFARQAVGSADTVRAAVYAVGLALNREIAFDAEATSVDTPMEEAFAARRGVCQDFTHVMISCLRGIGIPAGYVSGFLRTVPPPGQPRMEGADAMHAWVMAWCGKDAGWVEYDPTNAQVVGTDHIVVARGRDYADIAPVRGQMRSYGEHATTQSVDVVPLED